MATDYKIIQIGKALDKIISFAIRVDLSESEIIQAVNNKYIELEAKGIVFNEKFM